MRYTQQQVRRPINAAQPLKSRICNRVENFLLHFIKIGFGKLNLPVLHRLAIHHITIKTPSGQSGLPPKRANSEFPLIDTRILSSPSGAGGVKSYTTES